MKGKKTLFALGPAGTNGHEAAKIAIETLLSRRGKNAVFDVAFVETNIAVLDEAMHKKSYGVVPVENSSAGIVDVVRNFWWTKEPKNDLYVIGKIRLPVEHCLLTQGIFVLTGLERVISHPQALLQCAKYLDRIGVKDRVPATSTARAAQILRDGPSEKSGAIASYFAAELYGLYVAARGIEDFQGNVTFFHVVGPEPSTATGDDQTAIIFKVPNEKGALMRILLAISLYGDANMDAIHSIPLGLSHDYAFYCEFDGHRDDPAGKRILHLLEDIAERLVVLGSFPRPLYLRESAL